MPHPAGYQLREAGYYKLLDGSGPYSWDGAATFTLGGGVGSISSAQLPAALGPAAAAASLATTEASDSALSASASQVAARIGANNTAIGALTSADALTNSEALRLLVEQGEEAAANTNPVPVVGAGYSASVTFTPAAASHVANDCNGAAGTFTSMGPASGRSIITSALLEIDGATAEATAWRLYLYNVTPPSATADDGAWDLPSGDRASFLGYVDLGTAVDLGSTQWVETNGINKQIKLAASGNIFGYLVNLTTVTPAAVAHIVTLHSVGM